MENQADGPDRTVEIATQLTQLDPHSDDTSAVPT